MTTPIFNISYNNVYKTTIEFQTQINEKHRGREQRYPVWTYPKRTFTLKFEKTKEKRVEVENFFEQVLGASGQFIWVWAVEKGGNGKTYLCNFESDILEQNLYDYGFSEFELKFSAIDDTAFEPVSDFDFWHSAESAFNKEFYTITDKIFTSQNNRKAWWNAPKRSWTLTFEKTPENRLKLENYFIAKRGKFRSFNWTWNNEAGGDGRCYRVRFDEDILEEEISENGFGVCKIKIKEVQDSENPFSETQKDEIIPRKLLKIELEGGSIFILDNETLTSLNFGGETYLGAPLRHGEIKRDDNSSVASLEVSLSNTALAISGIIGARGDVITNAEASLTLIFLNLTDNTILQSPQEVLWAGHCNNLKLDFENATMDIETCLGGYEILAPIMKYRSTCQARRFKDCFCRYTGSATSCDRTLNRCKELGNSLNFCGFPQMYSELVIKV